MDAACEGGQPTVLLLSSVLPYIEAHIAMLTDVTRRQFRHIIIDPLGFVAGRDQLLGRVPPAIYDAGIIRVGFSRAGVLHHFANDYRLVAEWPGLAGPNAGGFLGLFPERKSL